MGSDAGEGIEALLRASLSPSLNSRFELEIVQQPIRGRMCGMGDKDRRPLTPPLIVKLHCLDKETGNPLPLDLIDTTFFILSADLRGEDYSNASMIHQPSSAVERLPKSKTSSSAGSRHSRSPSASPSTSTITTSRAPSPPSPRTIPVPSPCTCLLAHDAAATASHTPSCSHVPFPLSPANSTPALETSTASFGWKRRRTSSASTGESHTSASYSRSLLGGVPNLIGALHTNGFRLKDEAGQFGIFFIFPDLSVRSEGTFRIRLRFLSIGSHGLRETQESSVSAVAYTQPFTVCSAKRFEGMIDPTTLSKCFAKQGVRIPTRKVAQRKKRPRAAQEDDEEEDEE